MTKEKMPVIIIRNTRILKIFTFNSPWVVAIALFPFIIMRDALPSHVDENVILRHEKIHIYQQLELAVVIFFLWYFIEYIRYRLKGFSHFEAYRNIIFEKEANAGMHSREYLSNRKIFAFLKYYTEKK
ncbi:MAG: hypothetical protein N2316_12255 [Spirochaetes bacterium]|nr:hypothetical protein [Spirochaetota bacterium]